MHDMALKQRIVILGRQPTTSRCRGERANAVERVKFTIAPLYNGWQVRDELRNRDWCVRLEDAVAAADTLAQALHALTGKPTRTVIDDGTGRQRECGRHG
jgi:hypothetical protein